MGFPVVRSPPQTLTQASAASLLHQVLHLPLAPPAALWRTTIGFVFPAEALRCSLPIMGALAVPGVPRFAPKESL